MKAIGVQHRGVRISAGDPNPELTRLPSRKNPDGAPPELVDSARELIERGRMVQIRKSGWRALRSALFGSATAVMGVLLMVWGAQAHGESRVLLGVLLTIFGVLFAAVSHQATPAYRTRLAGRKVAGAKRASTDLWRRAVTGVGARRRTEAELPELHRLLIKVADAEDKVNRLVSRGKYQLDQSEADLARLELSRLIAEARQMLDLTPLEIENPAYLANRWAETANVPEPEPANPEELR